MTAGFIDIAGRAIHFSLVGDGKPVVVLESGLGSTRSAWAAVQSAVADFSAVFSYDRAGVGQSDPAPVPRTCQDMVEDLSDTLNAIALGGPFVVVGHSMGALLVRFFAARYPADVVGMVLVDGAHEARYERYATVLSEELRARNRIYLADPTRNSEQWNVPVCLAQVRDHRPRFDFPVRVLARGLPDRPSTVWPSDALQKIEVDLQRRLTELSPQSSFMLAEESGHFIQHDQPDLVVAAIRELVDIARGSGGDCRT